jgi:hypothetical protein
MRQLSGKYSEVEFAKSQGGQGEDRRHDRHGVALTNREWDQTVQRLEAMTEVGMILVRIIGRRLAPSMRHLRGIFTQRCGPAMKW